MTNEKKTEGQSGGVDISGGPVTVGGDIVGRDKVTYGNNITMGDVGEGAAAALAQWQAQMETKIEADPNLSTDDKQDLKDLIAKIQTEAGKGEQADSNRLEKLINTLAVMGPDIFEVAIATLANPFSGIGIVLKKIGDRVKLDHKGEAS